MSTNLVYCTLKDIYTDAGLETDTLSNCIKSAEKFTDAVCDLVNITDRDNLKQLMQYYITPRCINSIVDITEDTDLDHSDFVGKLAVWFKETNTRYSTLISYYLQTSGKLLDGIRSTSKSINKSSDTPEVDGDWDTDAQLSAIAASSTETVSDSASLIDQLDTIRKKYTDLFEGWADLFRAKFTQEVY